MAVWEGSSSSAWFRWGGVALVVAGLVAAAVPLQGLGFTLLVAGGALVLLERVDVQVDARGLQATSRWGFPRVRFGLDEIERVTAIDVRPSRWGGWGYRGSVSLFHRAAWVLHGGPGIRLDLTRGRTFLVAVDDAAGGAAALRELLTRPR